MKNTEKKIMVRVIPCCISANRELGYIEETIKAYESGNLEKNMEVVEETETTVRINFYR